MQEPKLLTSPDEIRVNEEARERRRTKKPASKKHAIKLRPFYCKGCGLCVDICPTGVLLLAYNKRSRWGISVIKAAAEYCIGCKMCEQRCPDFAIYVNYEADGRKDEK